MNKSLASALLLGGACALTGSSRAAVVFNDDFTTDQSSNYARWNADGTTDMALNGSGGNLVVTPGGANNNDRTLVRSFNSTSLINTGDSIKFSVDFYITGSGNPIRFGLYNIAGTITDGSLTTALANKEGYFTFFYSGSTSNATLRREYQGSASATNIMTGGAVGTTPASRPFITQLATDSENMSFLNSANVATLTLTVTKGANGNNTIESLISRNGVATSYSMTFAEADGYGVSTFNAISFYAQSTTIVYDNIRVDFTSAAIPEPGSFAAVAGLAALGAIGLRRKRHA